MFNFKQALTLQYTYCSIYDYVEQVYAAFSTRNRFLGLTVVLKSKTKLLLSWSYPYLKG